MNNTEFGYIYVFTFPNGKQYVGQTARPYKIRWDAHRKTAIYPSYNGYNYPLYKAVRLYGWDNVIKDVVCTCNKSQLDEFETMFIKQFNTFHPNGYNMTTGGGSGKILSEYTKKKIGASQKKKMQEKPISDDIKNRTSATMRKHGRNDNLPRNVQKRILKNGGFSYRFRHLKLNNRGGKTFKTLEECVRLLNILDTRELFNKIIRKADVLKETVNRQQILCDFIGNQFNLVQEMIKSIIDSEQDKSSETKK
jgi:group I intron endonuclease